MAGSYSSFILPSLLLISSHSYFLEQRYQRKSTIIITTNLDYPEWYNLFQRKTLVDAMLDRLRHNYITIHIKGESLRAPQDE